MLSLRGAGAFYYFYEMPRAGADRRAQSRSSATIQARIDKGLDDGAAAARVPAAKSPNCSARLDSLQPILPEEKDAADSAAPRPHPRGAVEPDDSRRSGRRRSATRQMHAEWPISLELEGTYHNLGSFLDRVSKFPRIINVGELDIRGKTQQQRQRDRST